MIDILSDIIFALGFFLMGMLWGAIVLDLTILNPKRGARVSAWFRRKLDKLDATRERKAQRLARRAHQKNSSKDA